MVWLLCALLVVGVIDSIVVLVNVCVCSFVFLPCCGRICSVYGFWFGYRLELVFWFYLVFACFDLVSSIVTLVLLGFCYLRYLVFSSVDLVICGCALRGGLVFKVFCRWYCYSRYLVLLDLVVCIGLVGCCGLNFLICWDCCGLRFVAG